MSFKDILLDLRSMRRSNALRKEDDPNKVASILEDIIKESIHLQTGGDKNFQRKSMAELKQIRRDLVAGQINAGDQTGKMTVVYSSVIDALSKAENEGAKGIQVYEKTAETLRKSIPSTDTLVSALMTANPLMGYGVKMVRDMTRSAAESRQRAKLEAAKKIALLRDQKAFLDEQFKAAEEAAKATEDAAKATEDGQKKKDKSDKKRKGTNQYTLQKEILESIDREIKMLVDIWSDEPVSRIEDAIKELSMQQAEEAEKTRIANEEAAEKERRNSKLDDMGDTSTTSAPTPVPDQLDTHGVQDPEHKEGGGLMSSIMGSIGKMFLTGIGGLFAAGGVLAAGGILATMLKPITGIIKFFLGIGKVATKLAGRLLLPVTVIMSLYDFFDGFFNASEYLKKKDSDISMTERIATGIANVIASIAGIFDDVLNMFGIDIIDTDGLTKKISDFFMHFPEMVMKMIDDAKTYVTDMYTDASNTLSTKVDDIKKNIVEAYTGVVDKIMGIFDSITTTFKTVIETIEKKFSEWKQTISNIPGIGPLFSTEPTEPLKLDPVAIDKASQDLKDMTSSTNLLRVNEGVATMVPLSPQEQPTGSQAASMNVQRAERQTQAQTQAPMMINAPQTTVNNVNQGGGAKSTNTSNTNHKFRRLADGK